MNRMLATTLLLLAIPIVGGCSGHVRAARPHGVKMSNAIFNPEWTRIPVTAIARSDWPSTAVFSGRGEEGEYLETIVDRQGPFRGSRDQVYYRRFESVRRGVARR